MLGTDVLKQRIEAARVLRGISQAELQRRFEADGLDKHSAGRVERGELEMQRVHRDAFCRHLRVPDRWFTEPEVDAIVGYLDLPERLSRDEAAAALLAPELLGAVQALIQAQAPGGRGTDTQGRPG